MIVTMQVGNSDDKLTQREWSEFVAQMRDAIGAIAVETHFFASSEGSAPWQNACWVVAMRESEMEEFKDRVIKLREAFKQDSVAVVVGYVQMW